MSEKKVHRPSADIAAEIKAKEDERESIRKRLVTLRAELRAAKAAEADRALAVYDRLAETDADHLAALLREIEKPEDGGDEQPDGDEHHDQKPDESPGF